MLVSTGVGILKGAVGLGGGVEYITFVSGKVGVVDIALTGGAAIAPIGGIDIAVIGGIVIVIGTEVAAAVLTVLTAVITGAANGSVCPDILSDQLAWLQSSQLSSPVLPNIVFSSTL